MVSVGPAVSLASTSSTEELLTSEFNTENVLSFEKLSPESRLEKRRPLLFEDDNGGISLWVILWNHGAGKSRLDMAIVGEQAQLAMTAVWKLFWGD